MTTQNPFAAAPFDDALSAVGVSAWLTQMVAEALSMQPRIQLAAVPSLAPDQQTVQQLATQGIADTASMMGLSALVLGYANQFLLDYPTLLNLAQHIDTTTDPTSRSRYVHSFVNGLNSLLLALAQDQAEVVPVAGAVGTLLAQMPAIQTAIDADYEAVKTDLNDDEIPTLEAQLDTIQAAIDADNKTIAKGTLHDLVDGVKMVIAIYDMGEEEEVKDGLKSLIGAVNGISATGNALYEATIDLNNQVTAYQQTLEQLTADQQTWAVVQNLDANTTLLATYLTDANATLAAFATVWQDQTDSLNALIATLNDPTAPQPTLTDYLSASVQTDWTTLKTKATLMQQPIAITQTTPVN
jgi:hypothetical protein